MRLRFITQAGTDREIAADAEVVLHVDPGVDRRVGDRRIADPPGEVARLPGLECGEAVERVGAEVVRVERRVPRSAVDEDARAQRVSPAHVVEIRGERERRRAPLARHLRAAGGECIEHLNGRRVDHRRLIVVRVKDAQPRVREHPALERAGVLDAKVAQRVGRVVRAIELVERADAEILGRGVLLAEPDAEQLILRQRVVEPSRRVEHVARRAEVERLRDRAGRPDDVQIRCRVEGLILEHERK